MTGDHAGTTEPRMHLVSIESSRSEPRRNPPATLALVLLIAGFLAMDLHFNWLVDDAFISYRYANNLAHGYGLRYNRDESPPVEGFSNLLWVLMLTPLERAGLNVPVAARLISVTCGAALLVLVWRHMRREQLAIITAGDASPVPCALALAWLSLSPSFAVWSTGGLETLPFILLLFLAFDSLLGDFGRPRGWLAAVVGIGLVLIRTEGWIWAAVLIMLACLRARQVQNRRPINSATIKFAVITAVAGAAEFAWRLKYYGKPFSNTVYTKVGLFADSFMRGFQYIGRHVMAFPALAIILLIGLMGARRGTPLLHSILLMVLFVLLTCVVAGGDWMPMSRLLVPALPFAALIAGQMFVGLWQHRRRTFVFATGIAFIALDILPAFNIELISPEESAPGQPVKMCQIWNNRRERAQMLIDIGRGIGKVARPNDSLVIGAIGAAGYFAPQVHIYDCFGLVEPDVANWPFKKDAVTGHQRSVRMSHFDDRQATIFDAVRVVGEWRRALHREMKLNRGKLPDLAYRNQALHIRERLSRELVSLGASEAYLPDSEILIIRRTGRTVAPSDRLAEIVPIYSVENPVRPIFELRPPR